MPLLSFVLCSRNDDYQGSPLWRLGSVLDFLAQSAERVGCLDDVEIVVADWGSDVPLREALSLSAPAARLTRFLEVPPAIATNAAADSPFPEVLALNSAVRRSRGRFVGRIDQDTLVDARFLEGVLGVLRRPAAERAFLFMGRRSIPYPIANRRPSLAALSDLIARHGRTLPREGRGARPWFDAPTGVALAARALWLECGGYDERLRYWGFMETDLGLRLGARYPTVDLGRLVGTHAFHLEHAQRLFHRTVRRKNPRRSPVAFHPNGPGWGLAALDLPLRAGEVAPREPRGAGADPSGLSLRVTTAIAERTLQEFALAASRRLMHALGRHPSDAASGPGRSS